MTHRPPPSGPQGPITLYAAIAPSMGPEQIAALIKSQGFRRSGAGLYVSEYDLMRLDLDGLGLAIDYLPVDGTIGTSPVIVHINGPDDSLCASALAAITSVVERLNPDILLITPPTEAVDPDKAFMEGLSAKLLALTGPTPRLYASHIARHAFFVELPSPQLPRSIILIARPSSPGQRWRDRFCSIVKNLPTPSSRHHVVEGSTVGTPFVDGLVVPLDGTTSDGDFLIWCRQILDQMQQR